jgi:hypothetical protein
MALSLFSRFQQAVNQIAHGHMSALLEALSKNADSVNADLATAQFFLTFGRVITDNSTTSATGITILDLPVTLTGKDAIVTASFAGQSTAGGDARFALRINGTVVAGTGRAGGIKSEFTAGSLQFLMDRTTYPAGDYTVQIQMYADGTNATTCNCATNPERNNASLSIFEIG